MSTDTAKRSPLCYSHSVTPVGRAWTEQWNELPHDIQAEGDRCPFCDDQNAREFRRQLRIALAVCAFIAAVVAYDVLVGQWRWNPRPRGSSFNADLLGTFGLFQGVFGGMAVGGWFAWRQSDTVNRRGTPAERWSWIGLKAVVLLGAPWLGMGL